MSIKRVVDKEAVAAFAYHVGRETESRQDREAWFRALEQYDFSQGDY